MVGDDFSDDVICMGVEEVLRLGKMVGSCYYLFKGLGIIEYRVGIGCVILSK